MLLGFVLGLLAGGFAATCTLAMVSIGRQSDRERELEDQLQMCRLEIRRLKRLPRENGGDPAGQVSPLKSPKPRG
jgi:hypothetical protein